MTHPLLVHLIAPGHTHRSLDAGVVDERLAHLRCDPKPALWPHQRGLEVLSKVSHALEPVTQCGDAMFGTLRRRGEASDYGMYTPLYQATARAGLVSRPVVMRAVEPVATLVCQALPRRTLEALHPDIERAQAAAASLLGALVATLPGQLFGLSVLPLCWTTSQTWAATKLAVLGSGYLAGFAVGQCEHTARRLFGQQRALPAPVEACNAVTFALETPIDDILPGLRFVTQDGRHVFDTEELAMWFQTSRTRRNPYTNTAFDAADDKRLARLSATHRDNPVFKALHVRWDNFKLSDMVLLTAYAATLVVAAQGPYVDAAIRKFEAFLAPCTPAERGALDAMFAGFDGAPLSERLAACRGSERQRRAAGAQLYAALGAPMLALMYALVQPSMQGQPDAVRLLAGLLARDMAVHACVMQFDADVVDASQLSMPSEDVARMLCQKALWAQAPATISV